MRGPASKPGGTGNGMGIRTSAIRHFSRDYGCTSAMPLELIARHNFRRPSAPSRQGARMEVVQLVRVKVLMVFTLGASPEARQPMTTIAVGIGRKLKMKVPYD